MAEQRYKAVSAVTADGRMITEVAASWGISRQTSHVWLARYEAGGLEALVDRSHRPASFPHQMDPCDEVAVLEMRRTHPRWAPVRIVHELARRDVVVSRSGVYRALRRAELIVTGGRRRRDKHWRRCERGRAMERWQMDVVAGAVLVNGTSTTGLPGIDEHCRS